MIQSLDDVHSIQLLVDDKPHPRLNAHHRGLTFSKDTMDARRGHTERREREDKHDHRVILGKQKINNTVQPF